MLDEPSSGLDTDETDRLAGILDEARRVHGVAVVLVEHDLPWSVRPWTGSTCSTSAR